MRETEGISFEGRDREILCGMKGWRPSAWPKLDTGIELGEAGEFLPDVGSIGLSFSARFPLPGVRAGIRGRQVPFLRSSGSAAVRSGNGARASAIRKRRQPFTLRE